MDEKYDPRVVIEDARHRHAAVVGLIATTDARAMTLLQMYVTLGVAAAAGAVGALFSNSATLPRPIGWALLAVVIALAVGSFWCFRAMRSTNINLPGRPADFWLWATRPDVTTAAAVQSYLDNLQAKNADNDALNARTVRDLNRAKLAGVCAPVAAIVIGLVAAFGYRS